MPLSLQPTENKACHAISTNPFYYQKQDSSYVKNSCAFRKSSDTFYPQRTWNFFSPHSCPEPRLSSLSFQRLRKRELPHPTNPVQLLLSAHLLFPSHSAVFLPAFLPVQAVQVRQQALPCSLDKLFLGAKAVEESWGIAPELAHGHCVHSTSKTPHGWVCFSFRKRPYNE